MADHNGDLTNLYPPGNNGTQTGEGKITEDGTGEIFTFNTPNDNNNTELTINSAVTFEIDNGKATDVKPAR